MRWLLLGLLVGCGEDGVNVARDARSDPAACLADRESAIDRTCSVPADCVLVSSADCCGTVRIAIAAGTQAGYSSVEATYEACLACPPLGCNHADQAEDGMTPQAGQAIVATCVASRCASAVQ